LRKRIQSTLALAVVLGLSGAVSSTTAVNANATTQRGPDGCAPGYMCTWPKANFGGQITILPDIEPGNCFFNPVGYLSAANRTTVNQRLAPSGDCVGGQRLGPNTYIRDLGSRHFSVGGYP
jgi:hypothetical protein